ncbi:MAG: hypothetical protein WC054_00755 [Candidatus Nanopelagicales bacterium]
MSDGGSDQSFHPGGVVPPAGEVWVTLAPGEEIWTPERMREVFLAGRASRVTRCEDGTYYVEGDTDDSA